MKKAVAILLALSLAGCARQVPPTPAEAYRAIAPQDVQMLALDGEQARPLCGIDPGDVAAGQVYVCADSLRADELWLLEAVDGAAVERLRQAAQSRLAQKAAESKTYDPRQYAVVQNAKTVVIGKFFALLVSPNADKMEKTLRGVRS